MLFKTRKSRAFFRFCAFVLIFGVFFALVPLSEAADSSLERSFLEAAKKGFPPLTPTERENQLSRAIGFLLKQNHLTKKPTDAVLSQRAFDLYLQALDPAKIYFSQSDLEEFSPRGKDIGKMVASGNIAFAFEVFNRYLQRMDQRITTVLELLDEPIDFTAEEEIVIDRKLLRYPQDEEEIRNRWMQRIKYELLQMKDEENLKAKQKQEKAEPEESLSPDWETLKKRLKRKYIYYSKAMHQRNNDDLLEIFLTALANAHDPHSSYMSPSSYEDFLIRLRLNLDGIGATLQSNEGFTVVKKLVSEGAAAKSGLLQAEDRIVAVGQDETGPMVDVYDMKSNDVVDRIRGKSGTRVRLEIVAPEFADKFAEFKEEGTEKPPTKIIAITRERVQWKDKAARSEIFEFGQKPDGSPYKLGIIDLPSFYSDSIAMQRGESGGCSTTGDVRKILREFVKHQIDAVLVDLRNNPGGSLPEAVSLTGLFIEKGNVVQTKDLGTKVNSLDDYDPSIEWTGPLVVMINKFSASASEIFAGAIKDYRRGILLGDSTTHGKGSVQDLKNIAMILFKDPYSSKYGALKLTVSAFYLPSGVSPQLDGVRSDVILPSLVDHLEDITEGDFDYPLSFEKIPASRFHPLYTYVNPRIVQELKQNSAKRVLENKEFQKILRKIALYKESKSRKTRPLSEAKFFEDIEKLRVEKDEIEKIAEEESENDGTIERDFYLEEAMSLTIDYITALDRSGIAFPREKSILQGGTLNYLFGQQAPGR